MGKSQFLEHIPIQIASNRVFRTSSEHKFGAVPAMSQNQTGTVWDINDTLYPWSSFDTAGVLTIPAVDANDDGHVITIIGLANDYSPLSEHVTVSSSGTTTTTNSFKRVIRAFCSAGGVTNEGNIDIQKGGTIVARITAGLAQTLMSIYTVPKGKTAFIMKISATCQLNADANGKMFIRYLNQDTFRINHTFELSGAGGQYNYDFVTPLLVPQKSDIDFRMITRTNNGRYTATFEMILIDNPV